MDRTALLSTNEPTGKEGRVPSLERKDSGSAQRRKKKTDKPRRPLSAYNMYFQSEREKLKGQIKSGDVPQDYLACSAAALKRLQGKAGPAEFQAIASTVAKRWKLIDQQERDVYEKMADAEMEKYKERKFHYHCKLVRECREAASRSSAGAMHMSTKGEAFCLPHTPSFERNAKQLREATTSMLGATSTSLTTSSTAPFVTMHDQASIAISQDGQSRAKADFGRNSLANCLIPRSLTPHDSALALRRIEMQKNAFVQSLCQERERVLERERLLRSVALAQEHAKRDAEALNRLLLEALAMEPGVRNKSLLHGPDAVMLHPQEHESRLRARSTDYSVGPCASPPQSNHGSRSSRRLSPENHSLLFAALSFRASLTKDASIP